MYKSFLLLQPFISTRLTIVKRVSAKRARARITRLEPLEQTRTMEQVLASAAPLTRQLSVSRNDTVANSTFRLSLECTSNIAFPSGEAID